MKFKGCRTCQRRFEKDCGYHHIAWCQEKGFYSSKIDAADEHCYKNGNCKHYVEQKLNIEEIRDGLIELGNKNMIPNEKIPSDLALEQAIKYFNKIINNGDNK